MTSVSETGTVDTAGQSGRTGQTGRAGRNSAVLVAFTAITNLADGVTKVVLPLLAAGLTESPAQVAAVGMTLTLPWLLAALHVGVLVDRADRRRLIAGANVLRLLAVAALAAALTTGTLSLPLLYAAGLVLGVAEVVALTALGAIVPSAVPKDRLQRTNAWVAGAETVANEFAGPAVGGLLIGLGAALSLGATAVAYVVGAAMLALLVGRFRAVRPAPVPGAGPAGRSVHAEIREGMRYLWSHRLLRTMTLTITVLAGCWSAWLALLPTFATHRLHLDSAAYGLLISAIGAGGLVGAVAVEPVNRLLGRRTALLSDLAGTFFMMAVPALLPQPWLIGAAAFLGGMGGTLWTVNSRTLTQTVVPGAMLGRFSAAARLLGWGTLPVGAALAGLIAELAGPRTAFAVFAALAALSVIPFLRTVTTEALDGAHTGEPA